MLGFAPLAALPLAAAAASFATATATPISVAGGFAFSGEAAFTIGQVVDACIEITWSGGASVQVREFRSTRSTIRFSGRPVLLTAGKPIVLNVLPTNYTLMAGRQDYTLTATPMRYIVRPRR